MKSFFIVYEEGGWKRKEWISLSWLGSFYFLFVLSFSFSKIRLMGKIKTAVFFILLASKQNVSSVTKM